MSSLDQKRRVTPIVSSIEGFREETIGARCVIKGSGVPVVINSKVVNLIEHHRAMVKVSNEDGDQDADQQLTFFRDMVSGWTTRRLYWLRMAHKTNVFNNFDGAETLEEMESKVGFTAADQSALPPKPAPLSDEMINVQSVADHLAIEESIRSYAEDFEVYLEKLLEWSKHR